jgi:antitoxin YefM
MTRFLTINEARKHLLNLPDQLTDEPIVITKHGKPAMVALGYEHYESLLETLEILSAPNLMPKLRRFKSEVQQVLMAEGKVLRKGFDSQEIF